MKQSDLDYFSQLQDEHPVDKAATLGLGFDEDTVPTGVVNASTPSGDDLAFFKSIAEKEKPYLPNASIPESSYGDVLSKAATNAKLGLMQAVGGAMQGIGDSPQSALQTLTSPQPELPENPGIKDYLSNYVADPANRLLAKGELAASILPGIVAPDAMNQLSNTGRAIQQEAGAQRLENQPNIPADSLKSKVGAIAETGLQLAPTLLAAGIAPESIPGLFGLQGAASTYAEQTNAGRTGGQALLPTVTSGIANMAIGDLPLGILTAEGGSLPAKLLKSGIAGEITSQGLNAVQQGINKGTIDPNMTWDQFKQSVKDIAGVGGVLGVAGGAVAHPFTKAIPETTPTDGTLPLGSGSTINTSTLRNSINDADIGDITKLSQGASPVETTASNFPAILKQEVLTPEEAPNVPLQAVNNDAGTIYQLTPEQLQALQGRQSARDISNNLDQQTAHPLLGAPDSAGATLQQMKNLREESLDNLLSKLRDANSGATNVDDINSINKYTNAVNDFYTKDANVKALKDQISTSETPIAMGDIPNSNTENVKSNLDAIANRQPDKLETPVIHDLIDNGFIRINDSGHPEMTDHGVALRESLSLNPEISLPESELRLLPAPDAFPTDVIASDKQGNARVINESERYDVQKRQQEAENIGLTPDILRTQMERSLESPKIKSPTIEPSEPKQLPHPQSYPSDVIALDKFGKAKILNESELADARRRQQALDDIGLTSDIIHAQNKRTNPSDTQYSVTPKNPDETRIAELEREHDTLPEDSARRPEIVQEMQELVDKINAERPLRLSDTFVQKKEQIASKVTDIIKRINPSVDVKLVRKLFGEGEALKASGSDSSGFQEVAGTYDKLKNLIHASLNTEKWNPTDTAYHEAFHSVRDMVSLADDAVLKKAFPGTDKLSQPEHEAVEFARFMADKNATGFVPAIRRIFSAMKQAFRDIGRTFKLGKFNSVEDIFNRTESGDIYKNYQDAIRSGDMEAIAKSTLDPKQQEQAIKEVSPALHEVVYDKNTDAMNTQAFLDIAAPTSPAVAGEALTNRIMNDNIPFDEAKTDAAIEKYLQFSMNPKEATEELGRLKSAFSTIRQNLKEPKKIASTLLDITLRPRDEIIRNAARNAVDPATGKKKLSPTAMHIADLFSFDTGKRTEHNFYQRINDYQNPRINLVERTTRDLTKSEKEQVASLLENPDQNIKVTKKVADAVTVLGKLGRESAEFSRQHGLEVDELDGFFPHQYLDNLIIPNRAEFVKDAVAAYRTKAMVDAKASGIEYKQTPEMLAEYQDAAQNWYRMRQLNDQGVSLDDRGNFSATGQTVPFPNSFKRRVFPKESYPYLKKWLNQDPTEVFVNHLHSVARKSVFNDMFGGDKWKNMEISMANEGVEPSDVRMIRQIVGLNTGALKGTTGIPALDSTVGAIRAISALTMLPLTWKNAVTETFTTGVQNGSLADSVRGFVGAAHAYAKMKAPKLLKNTRPDLDWARDLSDFLGVTTENASAYMNAARAQYEGTPAKYSNAIHNFIDVGQVQDITTANKDIALMLSLKNINKNAESIVQKDAYAKSSEYFLGKMLPPDIDVHKFAQYVMDNQNKQLKSEFLPFIADNTDPMAKAYRVALTDHVEKMVQTPTPATKALFATSPIASLAYYLSGFNMAFEKNVLGRNFNMMKDAVRNKDTYGKSLNFNTRDKLRVAYPMALTLGVLTAVSAASNVVFGDMLFHNKEKKDESTKKKMASVFLNAGFAGRYNSIASALMYKGNLDTNLIGPYAANTAKLAKDTITYATSKHNTNGSKRAFYRDMMSTIIAPTTNAALTFAPLPTAVKFPLMQIINAPQTRNAFVDTVAGQRRNH